MNKLFKYIFFDIIRSKIILFYSLALLAISLSIFNISDSSVKAIISLMNIQLIVIPLICGIFSTIYYYNSSEFIELLVAQPIRRRTIFFGILLSLVFTLSLAFLAGIGIPLLFYSPDYTSVLFLLTGISLTIIFTAFALAASVYAKDKARGIGVTLLIWFYFTLIYDGLILFLMFRFSDYPLEKAIITVSFFNPIDLVRVLILLKVDMAAIMGYTGAVFKDFFGTFNGILLSSVALAIWFIIPARMSLKKFLKKDL
jgi:Cu-processing system permease protein